VVLIFATYFSSFYMVSFFILLSCITLHIRAICPVFTHSILAEENYQVYLVNTRDCTFQRDIKLTNSIQLKNDTMGYWN
jgi:hypothetical protein